MTQSALDPLTGCAVRRVAQAGGKLDQAWFLEKVISAKAVAERIPQEALKNAEAGPFGPILHFYLVDQQRFIALATDPAHQSQFGVPGLFEAMAGMSAENQNLVPGPIERGPQEIEFYDKNGMPYDVKTPRSPSDQDRAAVRKPWTQFPVEANARSVLGQLLKTAAKKDSNDQLPVTVLLNVTHVTQSDLDALRQAIVKEALILQHLEAEMPKVADADLRTVLGPLVNNNALFMNPKTLRKAQERVRDPNTTAADLRALLYELKYSQKHLDPNYVKTSMTPQDLVGLCPLLARIIEVNT